MRTFADHNPVAVAAYYLCVTGVTMFCMDPLILALSLPGALICLLMHTGFTDGRFHLFALGLFLVMALINPLVSHNGVTVLFVMNHNPVTLEALLYGVAASAMIVSVLYRFRAFSQIMTSDKLLYLFGSLSPRLALVLSMALRYVPLFGQQAQKVRQAQRALGLYSDDNIVDSFRGNLRVFSVMITWALENGIITADSMTARGYGTGRRSRFSLFIWRGGDVLLLLLSLMLAGLTLLGVGRRDFTWYPAIAASPMTPLALAGYIAYGVLSLLPAVIEIREAIRWRCYMSRI